MKIYTRTGDQGTTGLFGGGRVLKDHLRIDAYGCVDELNAAVGVARAHIRADARLSSLDAILRRIQTELFIVGADLATPGNARARPPRVTEEHVSMMESLIDEHESGLEPLEKFILPAGSLPSSYLHLARTIARRSERAVVRAAQQEDISPQTIVYLNRLSDLLFVLARWASSRMDTPDELWIHSES